MMSVRYRSRGRPPDETEALQTDIMRFLAIICMCLMIVFSLVQSMPVAGTENRPKIQHRDMLVQDIQNLAERANRLTRQLKILENQIQQKQQTLERAARDMSLEIEKKQADLAAVRAMVQDARKKANQYRELARNARQDLSQTRQDLDQTARLVQQGRQKLKLAAIDMARAQKTLETLEIQKKKAERPAPAQVQEPKTKASEIKQSPAPKNAIPDKSTREEPVREEKEGFSLGFRSNQDLMDLLKHGDRAGLFLISGNKTWKLNQSPAGRLSFEPAGAPGKFYEMNRPTVPESIIRAGKRVVAAFGPGDLIYGVTLSPDITDQFKALMKGKKGGDLVISSTGRVALE